MLKVAVAQVGSVLFDTESTLRRVEKLCEEAAADGVRLIVFPEALLGGYPKGLDVCAVLQSCGYMSGGGDGDAGRVGAEIRVTHCDWGSGARRWHALLFESAVFAGGWVGCETSEADAYRKRKADLGDGGRVDDAGGGDGDWADRD